MDQIHGFRLEDIPPVINRTVSKRDIQDLCGALLRSYNPKQDPNGVQLRDIIPEKDDKYIYFFIVNNAQIDPSTNKPKKRLVFKLHAGIEQKDAQSQQQP